jgi:hypothetical protein
MNLTTLRAALAASRVALRFGDHAVIEAHKDGLTTEDLEHAPSRSEKSSRTTAGVCSS